MTKVLIENLNLYMTKKGLNASSLSKKVKLTRVAIGNILKGDSSPKLKTLEDIAKALDVSVCDLIGSSETKLSTAEKLERIKQLSDEVLIELKSTDGE